MLKYLMESLRDVKIAFYSSALKIQMVVNLWYTIISLNTFVYFIYNADKVDDSYG